jgi:Zn-finger nucleic acid-binding protein
MAHNCPTCSIPLEGGVFGASRFEECPQCAGVWILEQALKAIESGSAHNLEQLDSMETPAHPVTPTASERACPACGQTMQRFRFLVTTNIELDRCETCEGLWVDDGELAKMADAIEEANRPATPEELKAMRKAQAVAAEARLDQQRSEAEARSQFVVQTCKAFRFKAPFLKAAQW